MSRVAVCVGVFEQRLEGLESIPQCKNDVNDMAALLAAPECSFEVSTLLNPTDYEFRDRVFSIADKLGSEDSLLIYFSGHGRRNNVRHLQLCTTETSLKSLPVTSTAFGELLRLVKQSNVGSVLFILDCCFSGAAEKDVITKGNDDFLASHEDFILNSRGLSVLCSSAHYEVSLANKNDARSLFTDVLIEICNGARIKPGWRTVADIYKDMCARISNMQPKLIGENPMFPLVNGSLEANYSEEMEALAKPAPSLQPGRIGMQGGQPRLRVPKEIVAHVHSLTRVCPSVSNPNCLTRSFSSTDLPDWLQLDPAAGVIEGTPRPENLGACGEFEIALYSTDRIKLQDKRTISFEVLPEKQGHRIVRLLRKPIVFIPIAILMTLAVGEITSRLVSGITVG